MRRLSRAECHQNIPFAPLWKKNICISFLPKIVLSPLGLNSGGAGPAGSR